MLPNYSKDMRKNLTEIQSIVAGLDIPKGKYLQIVNRCAKVAVALNRAERAALRGAVRLEAGALPVYTHAEVVAECDKRIADKETVLAWLQEGRKVTTVDCIDANILRASDVIFRLRKEGWPIATRLVKMGRARVAEYELTGPKRDRLGAGFRGFETEQK